MAVIPKPNKLIAIEQMIFIYVINCFKGHTQENNVIKLP